MERERGERPEEAAALIRCLVVAWGPLEAAAIRQTGWTWDRRGARTPGAGGDFHVSGMTPNFGLHFHLANLTIQTQQGSVFWEGQF